MDTQAVQALTRFGLGRRPGEPLPSDPAAWLIGQIDGPDPARFAVTPTAIEGIRARQKDLADLRAGNMLAKGEPSRVQKLFRADAECQLANMVATDAPFRERLVWFWTNHFTVSLRNGAVHQTVGPFVRTAIRPHVTGRFHDLLLAVMRHPAMLVYLDNAGSIGPDSPIGRRTGKGLNENLARESLELHTLTPASGYTQADVTNYARILTGWSVNLRAPEPGFFFRKAAHEPGAKTVLGRTWPPGEAGGLAFLAFIADHPATHRALATRLVQYFVADVPPPDAVRQIEGVLRDTHGHLGEAAKALVKLEAAWRPQTKMRTPQDFAVAALRASGLTPEQSPNLLGSLGFLDQPLWTAPQPNGWADEAQSWATPAALLRRVDFAYNVAGRMGDADPMAVADTALGPFLKPATAETIRRAGSRREALAMVFASPEFQRR
jgi:uncharacterized protein (DUF1800 family)